MKILFCLIAGAALGTAAIGFGRARDEVGPLSLAIATMPSAAGRTVVDLSPLEDALENRTGVLSRLGLEDAVGLPEAGTVAARTHSTPLLVRVVITDVDPGKVTEILPARPASLVDQLSPIRTRLVSTMGRLAARTIGIGAAGGLLLGLLVGGRFPGALAGLAGGAGAPAAIFALTAATYDLNAFREPLAAAVSMLSLG